MMVGGLGFFLAVPPSFLLFFLVEKSFHLKHECPLRRMVVMMIACFFDVGLRGIMLGEGLCSEKKRKKLVFFSIKFLIPSSRTDTREKKEKCYERKK